MKKLRSLQGGYPRQQDYLLILQNELITMADALFATLGVDMVLKGCALTNHGNGTVSIAAGIVYISGEVVRFDGAANIISNNTKTFIKSTPINTDPKIFADGQSREVYSEVKAIIGNKASVTEIPIGVVVLYNLATYIQDVVSSYAIKGEVKDIYDLDGTFLENFDSTGLGVSARYTNWAMVNGNNGTPDAKGRVRVAIGTFTSPVNGEQTVFAHNQSGGDVKHKLSGNELPKTDLKVRGVGGVDSNNDGGGVGYNGGATKKWTLASFGNDQAHNNMQPYLTVYSIMKIA